MSYAAAAAASAQVNAQILPAAAGMSDLLGGLPGINPKLAIRSEDLDLLEAKTAKELDNLCWTDGGISVE